MKTYTINGARLTSWSTFHKEFKEILNFPDYYGANMDAWIDCMTDLTKEPTVLYIKNGKRLKVEHPELLTAILECAAFVNYRNLEVQQTPKLLIAVNS